MSEFTFIAADQHGRARKSDNKLVRSLCMRGKNEKADSRRSQRRARRRVILTSKSDKSKFSGPSDREIARENVEEIRRTKIELPDMAPAYGITECTPAQDMLMSNASIISFLNKVDDRSRGFLFKYIAYSIDGNILYPVERCLNMHRPVDFLNVISVDESFLQASLLSACSMNDYVMQQPPSALTIYHLRKLLLSLTSLLPDVNYDNIRSIIFAVITLGNVASMFGDYHAAGAHIHGLQRIVGLHGGREYLREFPKFHFKIDRLDLSHSLSTGELPLFQIPTISPPLSWQPFFAGSNPLPVHLSSALSIPTAIFPKFTVAYNDLRFLTKLINDKVASETHLTTDMFNSAIHSIQLRLLHLEGFMEDDVAECLRLGMLACLTTTYRLPGRKMEYPYLAQQLREMLQSVRVPTLGAQRMVFWVLMMSIVAIFEVDEPWIPLTWNRFLEEGLTWEEAKSRLTSAIWITCAHDEPAEKAFLSLELQRTRSTGTGLGPGDNTGTFSGASGSL